MDATVGAIVAGVITAVVSVFGAILVAERRIGKTATDIAVLSTKLDSIMHTLDNHLASRLKQHSDSLESLQNRTYALEQRLDSLTSQWTALEKEERRRRIRGGHLFPRI